MASHTAWKGYLRLSLVTVPVKAYATGNAPGGEIHLNQLHDKCKSRIRYTKTCPVHGEVSKDEIVLGYEFEKDQYVVVDPEEVKQLRGGGDKSIRMDAFVPAASVEPLYFSGRSYYLAPDSPVGQRPYALIRDSMVDEKLCAVALAQVSVREQIALLWPLGRLIVMSVLEYESTIKNPADFEDEIIDARSTATEQKLARQLISGMRQKKFSIEAYRDDYTEKLTELIEAKVEGREIVAPPQAESPPVINLMDALRKSMEQAKPRQGAKKSEAVKKKVARRTSSQTRKSVSSRAASRATRRKSG